MGGVALGAVVLELWRDDRLLGRRTQRRGRPFDETRAREVAERALQRLRREFERRTRGREQGRRHRAHFSARVSGPSGVYIRIGEGRWERVSLDEDRSLEPCRALAAAVVRTAVDDLQSGSARQSVAAARFLLSDLWQPSTLWGNLLADALSVSTVKKEVGRIIARSTKPQLIYQEVPEARRYKPPA